MTLSGVPCVLAASRLLKVVERFLEQGTSAEQVVDNLWLTAFGAVGVLVTVVSTCSYY
jgi:hypothetical protein